MLLDAHLHVREENFLQFLIEQKIEALINIANPIEFQKINPYLKHPNLHYSVGIHPWNVEKQSWNEMLPLLENTPIIGEIGLDSVWCDCDMKLQKLLFEKQLAYACQTKKKVILHTKGEEEQILTYLKRYPNTYLVHWYSCMDHLKEYIELGCYFTVGPNLSYPAILQVIQQVNLDHLLIESDGLSAIAWAKGVPYVSLEEYLSTLQASIEKIALLKQCSSNEVLAALHQNFKKFIHF